MTPLWVVSTGPGDKCLLPPMAVAALEQAEVVAGYGRYLDLLPAELLEGKDIMQTGMTGEVARCSAALETANAGRPTAVVSGGDAGIYGMAGLVYELAYEKGYTERVEVEVVPGIPALSAAAALLGAPLMHDFAAISLSDRLTPWEVIENRVKHAALGDFVMVIYNPRSKGRQWQLGRVLKLLQTVKPAETPVGVVRQAYREGQSVDIEKLGTIDPQTVDMLTVLVVGSASTRVLGKHLVTPRGYMEKYGIGDDQGEG